MTLRDRTALITGCSRGIGPYIARRLAGEGVHVAVTARTAAPLDALAARLVRDHGVTAVSLTADLRDPPQRVELVDRAVAALGRIDILVNNAGVEHAGAFAALPAAAIDDVIHVNVLAPLHLARLVLPAMLERGRGHIVSVASLAGKKAVAYDAAYGGSKAALIEWTSALRAELWETGVRASVVCPGYVTGAGMFARFALRAPRLVGSCRPDDVADGVVRALRGDRPEVLVNSMPVRPFLALYAVAPRLFDVLPRVTGLTRFQQRKAAALTAPS
jgi:short-subunit dehydrogenase